MHHLSSNYRAEDIGSEQKYALNRFGKFKGSAERIILDVEQSYKQSRRSIAILILLSAVVLLSNIA